MMGANLQPQNFGGIDYGDEGINEDFIPTAGATETFNPAVGDFFFDTGGPGGGGLNPSGGAGTELEGNYLNCGCVTTTTLAGVTQIEFSVFEIFGNFDWLKIYDGTDTTGTLLYDSNVNGDTDTFAGMVAYNGSGIFTGTSGAITFQFNATTVVDHTGWEVEILEGEGGSDPEYCGPITFEFDVEPITRVVFSDIDNSSSADPSSPAHEDYTSIVGNVSPGDEVELAVEGNTAGNWTNYFTAFIDWNQNGTLNDAGEVYEIGTITNSTGTDGQQAVFTITVPDDALTGETMMRVFKVYEVPNGYNLDPCSITQNFGQVEDYTLNIDGDGPPPGGECSQDFDGTPDNGAGFSDGYVAANDIVVAGNSTFTLQTITLEVAALSGEPSEFDLEIFSDNGTGGVGASTGETVHFDSSNMTYVPNGLLFGVYPQFTVTLTVPDIELSADTADDERYWLAIASSLSTTSDWTYWVAYAYASGSDSYPLWQNDGATWYEYGDGVPEEGVMMVEGICSDGGNPPTGDECEQGIPSQSEVPNAYNILTTSQFRSAEDFVVDADGFTLQTITIDTNQQGIPNEATIFIRADVAGTPGEVLHTITGAPDDSEVVGSAFGDPIYHLTFELDTPIDLAEGTYWLDPKMATATTGEVVWWAVADYDSSTHGAAIQQSTDNGTTWAENPVYSGIFTVSGICGDTEPGDGCEWTVSVFGSGFGDEVSWEFRDADGNVVLSGGNYADIPYSDTQTITAQDPVEFYIETMGTFNDNTPSFTIENGNGVVLSGTLAGGTEETYSDIMCSDTPPPPPAECEDHEVLDNGMENAYFLTNRLAVDIPVGDAGFTIEGTYITIAVPIGTSATSFNFIFYDDNSGVPGTEVDTATGTIIGSEIIGQNFGRDFIEYNVDFDAGMDLNANSTYWMEVQSDAEAWDWSSDSMGMIGYPGVIDNGGGWAAADGGEFVYALYCEEMGASDMNSSFNFAYYPNPVKDYLNIQSQKAIESIDAFNLAGQKVISNANLSAGKLNLSNLSTGTYVFRVTLKGGQVETFKIVKK